MRDTFSAQHLEFVSEKSFDAVIATLEAATGDVSNGVFERELAASADGADFERRMRGFEADTGFMRFFSLDFGGFMTLMGAPRRARQYLIGNPLIAITMAKHEVGAALHVPVRVLIYETADGRACLAYDLPSALMTRLSNPEVDAAAKKLDAKFAALAEHITGATA